MVAQQFLVAPAYHRGRRVNSLSPVEEDPEAASGRGTVGDPGSRLSLCPYPIEVALKETTDLPPCLESSRSRREQGAIEGRRRGIPLNRGLVRPTRRFPVFHLLECAPKAEMPVDLVPISRHRGFVRGYRSLPVPDVLVGQAQPELPPWGGINDDRRLVRGDRKPEIAEPLASSPERGASAAGCETGGATGHRTPI
jgi:hypothetical protein